LKSLYVHAVVDHIYWLIALKDVGLARFLRDGDQVSVAPVDGRDRMGFKVATVGAEHEVIGRPFVLQERPILMSAPSNQDISALAGASDGLGKAIDAGEKVVTFHR
jgi:hypothetical protein